MMRLTSPDGTTVHLANVGVGSSAQTYDDETNPPLAGALAELNGENVYGTWTLTFERVLPGNGAIWTISLERFEARLYSTGAGPWQ